MDRAIAMLLIGLFFGGGAGFTIAVANNVAIEGHDHANPAHHGPDSGRHAQGGHDHEDLLAIDGGPEAPQLSIEIVADPASGWNLQIVTRNFRFAPESASLSHVDGEGHAHIYVNGTKVARHYGEWFHIAEFPRGDNTVEVTLNANDHRLLAVGDEPLRAAQTITVE